MQYLLNKNIPRGKIITAVYGAVRPLVPNNSEETEQLMKS
jgi:outer membrane protein OmpA-like peptidoglycan-associated protein